MNPSQPEAGLQLPAPVTETIPTAQMSAAPEAPALAPPSPELANNLAQPIAAMPSSPAPAILPVPPKAQASSSAVSAAAAATPSLDDKDLIEKEWVERAKRIVEETRDDPYKQSEELTVVKADYLQTHYNKSIKLAK